MNDPRPSYTEARSALNGRLLTYCLALPVVAEIAGLVLGVALAQPWWFVIMAWMAVPLMICCGLLYRNWPTGIRMDEAGIGIGAVRAARAARRRPTVSHQSRGLFSCPWPAVLGVRVVTDRAELRQMRTSPQYYTLTNRWGGKAGMGDVKVGVLASPFMRAALVIEVDPFAATVSEVKPARFYSNFKDGRFSHVVRPQLSPVWVVPTRQPEALRAALREAPSDRDPVPGP